MGWRANTNTVPNQNARSAEMFVRLFLLLILVICDSLERLT